MLDTTYHAEYYFIESLCEVVYEFTGTNMPVPDTQNFIEIKL